MRKYRLTIIILLIEIVLFNLSNSLIISSQNFKIVHNKEEVKCPVLKTCSGEYTGKVTMPLCGTGTVLLGSRGDLRYCEIINQDVLGWKPILNSGQVIRLGSFFEIRTKTTSGEIKTKLLQGPLCSGNLGGASNELDSGFPKFSNSEFKVAYLLIQGQLKDQVSAA